MKYWVLFGKSDLNLWWLKKGYRHVSLLTHDKFNWLLLSACSDRFYWSILSFKVSENVPFFFNKEHTIVVFDQIIYHNKDAFELGINFLSCVQIAKYMLGVKKFFIFTPYQLYNYLLKNGGSLWAGTQMHQKKLLNKRKNKHKNKKQF